VYLFYLMAISGNKVAGAIGRLAFEALMAAAIATPIFAAKLLHAGDVVVTITAGVSGLIAAAAIGRRSRGHAGSEGAEAPKTP